jgi:lysophospholipase L1-like esterase
MRYLLAVLLFVLIEMSWAKRAVATVLCFGDSWTYGNSIGLTEQLRKHGHHEVEVVTKDYWGSTAEYFANNQELLPKAVEKHKADYVLLSMGGNDFKNIYWRKRQYVTPWTALSQIEANMRSVLDSLYERHPEVKVVTYGYDFPGSISEVVSGSFWSTGAQQLSSSTRFLLFLYNTFGIRFINYSAMQLGVTLNKLSKDYAKRGHSFTYVPLWGTLQKGAAPADKKFSLSLGTPSPSEFMNDPIHANPKGFSLLLAELYESYFRKEISAPISTDDIQPVIA